MANVRTVSVAELNGFEMPGIVVRDHFRRVPENRGGPHYGLGPLHTLADTTIQGHSGFPMHAHQDMEIVTYVCEGRLTHEDSLGNRGLLEPGDMQAMTTGTGIQHSEANEGDAPARIYQFWIEPLAAGLDPSYVDVRQPKRGARGRLCGLASGSDGYAGRAGIRADVTILGADLDQGQVVEHPLEPVRRAYVLVARGRVSLNGTELRARDGAQPDGIDRLVIEALEDSDVLVVDLPQ